MITHYRNIKADCVLADTTAPGNICQGAVTTAGATRQSWPCVVRLDMMEKIDVAGGGMQHRAPLRPIMYMHSCSLNHIAFYFCKYFVQI